jgi:hypothetical protein
MGKYGTNLEGFGAFEGGVNADKGAPLVSTSSDGETALLFGPAALREIQAGVANGDFAIPPDAAGDTITESNPLPYWTFTDVNSAGAITAAIVSDAGVGSGNVLTFTIASGTLTGKSATLTRYIPVASSLSRSFAFYAEATFDGGTPSTQATAKLVCQFYKSDGVTAISGASFDSATYTFTQLQSPTGITAPDFYGIAPDFTTMTAPADAAFLKLTITIATVATQSAQRVVGLTEVRVTNGVPEVVLTDKSDPATYPPALLTANNGVLNLKSGSTVLDLGDGGELTLGPDVELDATNTVTITSGSYISLAPTTNVTIDGANSEWISRATNTAAQALVNNTSTAVLLNTASATPTTGSYDPNAWFVNANDEIEIGQDGFYAISGNIAFAANAVGRRSLSIIVNGADAGTTQVLASPAASTILSVSTNLYLAAGDTVRLTALQQSGGALNTVAVTGVYPALSVGRIGA